MSDNRRFKADTRVTMEHLYHIDPFLVLADLIKETLYQMREQMADAPEPIQPHFDTFNVVVTKDYAALAYKITTTVFGAPVNEHRQGNPGDRIRDRGVQEFPSDD